MSRVLALSALFRVGSAQEFEQGEAVLFLGDDAELSSPIVEEDAKQNLTPAKQRRYVNETITDDLFHVNAWFNVVGAGL